MSSKLLFLNVHDEIKKNKAQKCGLYKLDKIRIQAFKNVGHKR